MIDYPEDPIVGEIRAIRKAHAEKFHNNLHAICEDISASNANPAALTLRSLPGE